MQEAQKRGIGAAWVGIIFSSYSFVDIVASPLMGIALQKQYVSRQILVRTGLLLVSFLPAIWLSSACYYRWQISADIGS